MDLPASNGNWASEFQPQNYLAGLQLQQGVKEQNALGDLTIATKKQQMETENALAPYKIQEAGEKADLGKADYENQMIASVAQRAKAADQADAPQVWDKGMQALADKGINVAGQYVGHYRQDLADHVYNTFTGQKDQADQAPPGMDAASVQVAISKVPAPMLQKTLGNLNMAITGYNRIKTAQDLRNEVKMLQQSGMNLGGSLQGLNLDDDSPAGFAANYSAVSGAIKKATWLRDQMQARAVEMSAGIDAQPKPLYEPDYQYLGPDQKTGGAVTMEKHTGNLNVGQTAIGPKPSAATSLFAVKYQAAINQGYPPAQALEFANGKRAMEPAQMQAEAIRLANQELGTAMFNSPESIPDPAAWVRNRASQIYTQLQQASGAGAVAGGAPGGRAGAASRPAASAAPPAKAVSAVKAAGGKAVRFQNGQVWMWKNGKAVRVS